MGTPVSGPGQFARRTDRQPIQEVPGGEYGDRQEITELQQAAPMAADQGGNVNFADLFGAASGRVIPFGAPPSDDLPVTNGAALGAGAGPEALSSTQRQSNKELVTMLPVLEWMANRRLSDSARNLIRNLKGSI